MFTEESRATVIVYNDFEGALMINARMRRGEKHNVRWCLSNHRFLPLPAHVFQLISSRVTGLASSSTTTIMADSICLSRVALCVGEAAIKSARASVHKSRLSDVSAPTGKPAGDSAAREMMRSNCLYKKEQKKRKKKKAKVNQQVMVSVGEGCLHF